MREMDTAVLAETLNGLAETFERKHITPAAFKFWFRTLKDFPVERVIPLLDNWPKTHAKMPAPADVWKVLNDSSIDEREEKAKSELARRAYELKHAAKSPDGARVITLIGGILARPKLTPVEHWAKVLGTEGLPQLAYDFAMLCLPRIRGPEKPQKVREPGQDDEERAYA